MNGDHLAQVALIVIGVKLEIIPFYRRDRGDRRDEEGLILCVLGGLCGEIWFVRNEDS